MPNHREGRLPGYLAGKDGKRAGRRANRPLRVAGMIPAIPVLDVDWMKAARQRLPLPIALNQWLRRIVRRRKNVRTLPASRLVIGPGAAAPVAIA
jgi:hypothetical protein